MRSVIFVLALVVMALFMVAHNAVAADGPVLYKANKCAMCHGDDGKGNEKMKGIVKGDLTKLDLTDKATVVKTDAELAKVISDGAKPMKAYKDLTPDQVTALVKYIRTLK